MLSGCRWCRRGSATAEPRPGRGRLSALPSAAANRRPRWAVGRSGYTARDGCRRPGGTPGILSAGCQRYRHVQGLLQVTAAGSAQRGGLGDGAGPSAWR
jgi:hypothetical protein